MDILKFKTLAATMASYSKDPSTKVGCVIVDDDGDILSTGWNGFPRGVKDHPWRYNNRDEKLKYVVHAEANALANAARNGKRIKGTNLIVTALYPCSNCAGLIIQAGIKRVFAPPMPEGSQWLKEAEISITMFEESGVELVEYEP